MKVRKVDRGSIATTGKILIHSATKTLNFLCSDKSVKKRSRIDRLIDRYLMFYAQSTVKGHTRSGIGKNVSLRNIGHSVHIVSRKKKIEFNIIFIPGISFV